MHYKYGLYHNYIQQFFCCPCYVELYYLMELFPWLYTSQGHYNYPSHILFSPPSNHSTLWPHNRAVQRLAVNHKRPNTLVYPIRIVLQEGREGGGCVAHQLAYYGEMLFVRNSMAMHMKWKFHITLTSLAVHLGLYADHKLQYTAT